TKVTSILSHHQCIKILKEQKYIDKEKEELLKKYISESENKYNSIVENPDYKNEISFIKQYKLLEN
ncbi:MAG: hypothetical protein KA275_03745, partial [Chitinophagaceae bacterium]|nr:hypothetical protein [Chitinophagaceae bacterium]